MKRFQMVFLITLVGMVSLASTSSAGEYSGLWVGTASLKYVSEVNKQYADLSFDLGLVGVKAHDPLVTEAAGWRYNDSGTAPDTDWMGLGFEDSGWSSGTAPFGSQNQTTVYFRKSFTVADRSIYSGLRIKVWRDDGVVLYLNGEKIFRNNLPTGSIDFDIFALSEITDDPPLALVEFTLPATLLRDGQNLLAAEVHQADGSTDFLFDLKLNANLEKAPTTELIALEADNWRYHDSQWGPGATSETDPIDANWHSTTYKDSGWSTGRGQFGFGENDEQTSVRESASTLYFRKTFSGNSADFTHLRILLLRDDGAILCVNGNEVLRSNMPSGTVEHGTAPVKALGSADEGRYIVVDVEVPALEGANVIAVELHQHPAELGGTTGGDGPALTRTAAPLDLRLMFHVDAGGTVRLLKEVIQMYDSKTNQYVLLTDHTEVPNYTGVAVRDGEPVGRRLSALGFDFVGTSKECDGGISGDGIVTCAIQLDSSHPTNPFLHRYHPDHDNLDERYENAVVEAYEITRVITLEFSDRYPSDEDLPGRDVKPAGWGLDMLGGYYTETLTGIHKDAITVHGPFILNRVVTTDTLNE